MKIYITKRKVYLQLLFKIIIMISSGLLFILIGAVIQQTIHPGPSPSVSGINTNEVLPLNNSTSTTISGIIQKISGQTIILNLATQKQIKVISDESTLIVKHTRKDAEEIQSQTQLTDDSNLPLPSFNEEPLTLKDLTKNQEIVVDVEESLIGKSTIKAKKITIYN
jgi:hypothetical protein